MYIFRSNIGVFRIGVDPYNSGRLVLTLGDERLGYYHSPMAAADDVYVHCTGCYGWDCLDGKVDAPRDLSEWERT